MLRVITVAGISLVLIQICFKPKQWFEDTTTHTVSASYSADSKEVVFSQNRHGFHPGFHTTLEVATLKTF